MKLVTREGREGVLEFHFISFHSFHSSIEIWNFILEWLSNTQKPLGARLEHVKQQDEPMWSSRD